MVCADFAFWLSVLLFVLKCLFYFWNICHYLACICCWLINFKDYFDCFFIKKIYTVFYCFCIYVYLEPYSKSFVGNKFYRLTDCLCILNWHFREEREKSTLMSPLIYKWKPFVCSGNHVERFIVPLTTFRNVHLLVIQIPSKAYSMLSVVCFTLLIIIQAKIN